VADTFEKLGALKPETGDAFRQKVLSRGNTKDQMEMFTDFTGMKNPDASGFLKYRGL
jgi:peptidyl-dipeptidase Dcp